MNCHVSCSTHLMDRACGREEPGEFMEDFVQSVFTETATEFKQLGILRPISLETIETIVSLFVILQNYFIRG